ncbi:hypothetical protein PM082_014043 [Marasmius tenuissimus]|nr:hypothetical protein PM082_014043 [Marasmius tenuissimus]
MGPKVCDAFLSYPAILCARYFTNIWAYLPRSTIHHQELRSPDTYHEFNIGGVAGRMIPEQSCSTLKIGHGQETGLGSDGDDDGSCLRLIEISLSTGRIYRS